MSVSCSSASSRSLVVDADAVRFGAIVRRLRQDRRWTVKKLAKLAGLHPTYVGVVEQGGNVPSLSTILGLIEVLEADIAEVMRELALARKASRR